MDLMGVGTAEILMILLVAIIVVGPRKIVDIARTMGKITRTLKKASTDLMSSVTKELELEDKEKSSPSQSEKKGT
jgi:sec-independent protein translocase protein TatB